MTADMDNQPINPDQHDSARIRKSGAEKETVFIVVGIFLIVVLGFGLFLIYQDRDSSSRKLTFIEQRMTALEQRLALFEKQQVKLHEGSAKTSPEKVEISENRPPEKVKPPVATSNQQPTEKKRYHEVQNGETLFRIARKYGISIEDLRRTNNLSPQAVLVRGQKLLISTDAKG